MLVLCRILWVALKGKAEMRIPNPASRLKRDRLSEEGNSGIDTGFVFLNLSFPVYPG